MRQQITGPLEPGELFSFILSMWLPILEASLEVMNVVCLRNILSSSLSQLLVIGLLLKDRQTVGVSLAWCWYSFPFFGWGPIYFYLVITGQPWTRLASARTSWGVVRGIGLGNNRLKRKRCPEEEHGNERDEGKGNWRVGVGREDLSRGYYIYIYKII